MKRARMQALMLAIQSMGLIVVEMPENLWLILVPAHVTTVRVVNESGFNPHEVKEDLDVARCVILGWGKHRAPEIGWKTTGADYWVVETDEDVIAALADVGFNIREALEAGAL